MASVVYVYTFDSACLEYISYKLKCLGYQLICMSNREEKKKNIKLTIKLFMPRDKRRPHIVAALLDQILKIQFALLVEFVLHLRCAAGVSLRTDTQVFTWGTQETQSAVFTHIIATGFSFSKGWAESLIKTLLWFWDSHHQSYQRGTERDKWGRIIFVGNLLSCETESNFDTAVHIYPMQDFLYITVPSTAITTSELISIPYITWSHLVYFYANIHH